MEDFPPHGDDRDLTDKFFRILREQTTTNILVYWPRAAKMQTTLDEIIHLRHAMDQGFQVETRLLIQLDIIHRKQGRYEIAEGAVSRSRYLDSINTLRPKLVLWSDEPELFRKVGLLTEEFH
jgi:hypothetical protein